MRKSLFAFLTILLFGTFGAVAQNTTNSPPSSTSPSPQDSSQSSTGQSAGEQTIEGCIVRESSTYYIQPTSGSRTKLNTSTDVASNVGNHVVVHGAQQSSSASNAGTNPGSSSATSGQSTSSGDQTFNVTRVDTIATNCPANMGGKDTSNPK
jgi:hypothetical protein